MGDKVGVCCYGQQQAESGREQAGGETWGQRRKWGLTTFCPLSLRWAITNGRGVPLSPTPRHASAEIPSCALLRQRPVDLRLLDLPELVVVFDEAVARPVLVDELGDLDVVEPTG